MSENRIIRSIDWANVLDLPQECVSDIALVLPDGLSYHAWKGVGERILTIRGATQWWIGDWVLSGERCHPQVYSQALPDYSLDTIRNYTWVASRIEPRRRRVELTFSHHQEVARLGESDQDRWLKYAVEHSLTTAELRAMVVEERVSDGIEEPKPERVKMDKDAIKDLSISCLGQPWTPEQHNALMQYLNINHRIQNAPLVQVGGEHD